MIGKILDKLQHFSDYIFYRFVLYQLSKNLNRPFFMDFLTHLSVRYAHGHVCDEEADTEEDDAPLIGQMNKMLKPSSKVSCYF